MAEEQWAAQVLVVDGVGPHRIGGAHALRGAECPNCRKPLMLHVMLDCSDGPLVGLGYPFRWLPLLYCARCALPSTVPFMYRLTKADEVELLAYYLAPSRRYGVDWRKRGLGVDVLPEAWASLKPLPRRVQAIYDALNQGASEDSEMRAEVALELGRVIPRYQGGAIRPPNLVLGCAYNWNHIKHAMCNECADQRRAHRCVWLASLYTEPEQRLIFGIDGTQIVFYLCRTCWAISANRFERPGTGEGM